MDRRKVFSTENMIFIILLTTLLCIPMVSYANGEIGSHPANSMWVEPQSIILAPENATIGYKFNVTIWLNISDIQFYSYSIGLLYNRTQLKAIRGDFTKNFTAGHETVTAGPVIDTSYLGNGSVLATESLKGEDYIQGPKVGTLLWIEFEVIAEPPEGQTLTSQIDITTCYPEDTWVMDYNLQYVDLNGFNAQYAFIPEFSTAFTLAAILLASTIIMLKTRNKRKN